MLLIRHKMEAVFTCWRLSVGVRSVGHINCDRLLLTCEQLMSVFAFCHVRTKTHIPSTFPQVSWTGVETS